MVLRIESVTFGLLAVQPEQKSSTSTRLIGPVTVGVNVWPAQLALVMPKPVGLTVVFLASVLSGAASTTLPGVETRSQLEGLPPWNVDCELSVKQPLCGAELSVKFCVAVPPSGTTIGDADAGSNPSFAAITDAYVPAGTVNE